MIVRGDSCVITTVFLATILVIMALSQRFVSVKMTMGLLFENVALTLRRSQVRIQPTIVLFAVSYTRTVHWAFIWYEKHGKKEAQQGQKVASLSRVRSKLTGSCWPTARRRGRRRLCHSGKGPFLGLQDTGVVLNVLYAWKSRLPDKIQNYKSDTPRLSKDQTKINRRWKVWRQDKRVRVGWYYLLLYSQSL